MLVFISTISEGTDCIDIKWILSHADNIRTSLYHLYMCFFIDSLRIGFYLSFYSFLTLEIIVLEFRWDFLSNLKIFSLIQWKSASSPFPLKLSFTFILRLIEETSRANLIIDNRDWLKSISQDDIGIHSSNIDMVDKRECLIFMWVLNIS